MLQPVLGLSLALDERGLLVDARTRVHLVAEITALRAASPRARPPLSVVLAVDTSGSMAGPPIEQVLQSIDRLATLLDPEDRLGVVAFSDESTEVARLAPAGPDARRVISLRARRLVAEGGTNIEAGLRHAAAMMPARSAHERQVILLLSDGAPNRGVGSAEGLADIARSHRPDIGVSTLGYGPQHQEDLLRAIADGGAGRYHFITDPSVCAAEFAVALGTQGDIVAEGITLGIDLAPGVQIERFLGDPTLRGGASGLRIDVPDLLEGARHLVVAELSLVTPHAPGAWKIARGSLAFHRAGERAPLGVEAIVSTVLGWEDRAPVPAARAEVLLARTDEVRAEARALADRRRFDDAVTALRQHLAAVLEERWFKAGDGSPLAEAVEQMIDDAAALARSPSPEEYQSYRKTKLAAPVTTEPLSRSISAPMSTRVLATIAGALPRARLVIVNGEEAKKQIPLDQPRVVIGRTPSADIQVRDRNVSRQQALLSGQEGRFMLLDLSGTNPTKLNGQALEKPQALSPGDVIGVGDVVLRYEEE